MTAWLTKLPKPLIWAIIGLAALALFLFGMWRRASRLLTQTKILLELREAERDAAKRSAERERQAAEQAKRIRDEANAARTEVEDRIVDAHDRADARVTEIRTEVDKSGTAADLINDRINARERGAR